MDKEERVLAKLRAQYVWTVWNAEGREEAIESVVERLFGWVEPEAKLDMIKGMAHKVAADRSGEGEKQWMRDRKGSSRRTGS